MASITKRPRITLTIFTLYLIFGGFTLGSENPNYIRPSVRREECQRGEFEEYFDLSQLACKPCTQNATMQSVSMDGLRCVCNEEYRLTKNFGGGEIQCEKCPPGTIASLDGWECTSCSVPPEGGTTGGPEVVCGSCADSSSITADRNLDGDWLTNNQSESERTCVFCTEGTLPNTGGKRCTRCNDILKSQSDCDCPQERQAGGLCFDRNIEPDSTSLYEINFESEEEELPSAYFRTYLRAAHAACAPPWSNLTACQQVANLCTLLLYDLRKTPSPTGTGNRAENDACSLYHRLTSALSDNILPSHNVSNERFPDWKVNMPWLFYNSYSPSDLLTDTDLPAIYTRGGVLNISLAVYDVTGGFLGYTSGTRNTMSLCGRSEELLIDIGTQLTRECYLSVDMILNDTDFTTTFYDPYISFSESSGVSRLYHVPVLIWDLRDTDGATVNTGSDRSKWRFVRRYFLLDNMAGREELESPPKVVRYVMSMTLHITLQDKQKDGRIFIPWLEVKYGEVNRKQYGQGQKVKTKFKVVYDMDLDRHKSDLAIAIGVLSGIAVIYSAFQAHNHNRREGKVAIDFLTLLHLAASLCGTLANAFLVVILGASIWWFLLYKMQKVMFLVPTLEGDYYIRAFLGSAFALKTVNIIYLLVTQCNIDMFLLDWERPKDKEQTDLAEPTRRAGQTKVSIWRTYFVANEWNELSTVRRINMAALLLVVCLILQGEGLEKLAQFEMSSNLHSNIQEEDGVVCSRVMRFALSSLVYIGVAFILWVFNSVVLCLFINDRVAAFRDVCAMCNVSAFLMTHQQFGYYVHGRSVHGYSDVGLREMHENLSREEKDLCGSRGLEPGTDHQTYEVALPRRLREEYNKVLLPVKRAKARQKLRSQLDADSETELLAYDVLNRFLQRFIEHGLRDLDYIITKKNLAERILDTEIEDNRDLGYFYVDEGLSFTRTLLCGHELSMLVFSLLLFAMVDLIGTNFVLAAAVTYGMDEVIRRVRYSFGRRNIASKTLVDARLLI